MNGDEETKGTIIAQDPKAGVVVDVDSTVTITVNDGPKTAVIPDDLVGKDVDNVEEEPGGAGLHQCRGRGGQDRGSRHQAQRGAPDLAPGGIDRRPGRQDHSDLRDRQVGGAELRRAAQARAIETADEAGFDEPTFTEETSDAPAGTVIAQNPKAGAKVDRDTKIALTLAKAPVEAPDAHADPDRAIPTPIPTPSRTPS